MGHSTETGSSTPYFPPCFFASSLRSFQNRTAISPPVTSALVGTCSASEYRLRSGVAVKSSGNRSSMRSKSSGNLWWKLESGLQVRKYPSKSRQRIVLRIITGCIWEGSGISRCAGNDCPESETFIPSCSGFHVGFNKTHLRSTAFQNDRVHRRISSQHPSP